MIPRNRALSNTKGFQAQADVGINSPSQTNTQSVNVVISPLTKDRNFEIITDKSNFEHKQLDIKPDDSNNSDTKFNNPLSDEIENNNIVNRSIETAEQSLTDMKSLLNDKDNLIEALSLLLDIYENNPLIINKIIVATEDELTRLLFLLTGADEIQLIKSDPEIKCCYKITDKIQYISKIMVKKNNNTYNLKYSFPNVVQLLENRKICWKMVV